MGSEDDIHGRIERLVAEEHELWERRGDGSGLSQADHDRLEKIRIEFDRYWDLLRQRRALEEFGMDPDVARMRDEQTVEGYEG